MLDIGSVSGAELLFWMLVLGLVAFAVPWLLSDLWDLPRWAYVVALAAVSVVSLAVIVTRVGPGLSSTLSWHWLSGLLVAPIAGMLPALGIIRMPATRQRRGAVLAGALGWDAVIYGAAEGLLLSALPAYLAWHYVHALAPTQNGLAYVGAVAFSVLVIVVHHLGYPEFRHPRGLIMAGIACGLLTVGYLVTGSIWTPVVGHVLMHTAAVVKGNALPPHSDAAVTRRQAAPARQSGMS